MSYIKSGTELVRLSQEKSAGYKRHARIRRELFAIANMRDVHLKDWSADDILDYVLAHLRSADSRIKNNTLMQVVKSIKDVYEEMGYDTYERNRRAITCGLNFLRAERLKELDSNERTQKPKLIKVQT